MAIVKTSSKGQIVIPKEIRRRLGLKAGQRVNLKLVDEQRIEITAVPADPVEAYCGVFRKGSSLTAALLKERRQDLIREENKRT
ncbi:MAG: AbrB/MazE/SpoVT family DNA-binding domain-containing protein [Chloroflexi bacterium]|nr:AbrB/MazE/SpoVT family DNA-binding domain-containing protein [Chloroflexota bacterium]